LLGMNFDELHTIKMSSKQRQSFLTMLLLYFELHLGSFKKPKSLQVLNQVFN
jgi:DNA repair protein RecO (recombination protein O)